MMKLRAVRLTLEHYMFADTERNFEIGDKVPLQDLSKYWTLKSIETPLSDNKEWVSELLESLDEDKLKELLGAVSLIVDPLGQELIKRAASEEV